MECPPKYIALVECWADAPVMIEPFSKSRFGFWTRHQGTGDERTTKQQLECQRGRIAA